MVNTENPLNRVHISRTPIPQALAVLKDRLRPGISLSFGQDIPVDPNYGILVDGRPSRELILASPNLKFLLIPWAGLPEPTKELMLAYPHVSVHNLHHNAIPTAEMAVALLFAVSKSLIPIDREFRKHDWTPRYQPNPSMLLNGKTALILGYGSVGKHIGFILKSLGIHVIGIKRKIDTDEFADIIQIRHLKEQLPKTDILIIALPLTPETEEIISFEELSLLPYGAVVVNVGRGAVINQQALFQSLVDGHLGGAGLDVWYSYPQDEQERSCTPPANFPFHELENVVMSPHRAGGSKESEKLRMIGIANFVNAVINGEDIPNRVNLVAGY